GMLAARISFMNMIARLCGEVGADVDEVRLGIGTDSRIGPAFLFEGCGYGGSCFPKDVRALVRTMAEYGVDASLLEAVERVNHAQKRYLLELVDERFGGKELSGLSFGVWGLSFKPDTDDMREAPAIVVVEGLLERGARVQVHDPQALEVARRHFGDRVTYCDHNYDALADADALVIVTEWKPYRRPDFAKMRGLMRQPIIFDGRNLFEPERMRELGFEYYSVGRPRVSRASTRALAPRRAARARCVRRWGGRGGKVRHGLSFRRGFAHRRTDPSGSGSLRAPRVQRRPRAVRGGAGAAPGLCRHPELRRGLSESPGPARGGSGGIRAGGRAERGVHRGSAQPGDHAERAGPVRGGAGGVRACGRAGGAGGGSFPIRHLRPVGERARRGG